MQTPGDAKEGLNNAMQWANRLVHDKFTPETIAIGQLNVLYAVACAIHELAEATRQGANPVVRRPVTPAGDNVIVQPLSDDVFRTEVKGLTPRGLVYAAMWTGANNQEFCRRAHKSGGYRNRVVAAYKSHEQQMRAELALIEKHFNYDRLRIAEHFGINVKTYDRGRTFIQGRVKKLKAGQRRDADI